MFEGPADELTLTENAQPALMAVSMAVVREIEAASGKPLKRVVRLCRRPFPGVNIRRSAPPAR